MGRGRNRTGFWAKVGLKICCDLGEEMEHSRQEKHPVFTNKEAGLYTDRINHCSYFRMADVWALSSAVGKMRLER